MKKLFTIGICMVLLTIAKPLMAQHSYFYSLKYIKIGQKNVEPPYKTGMYVTFPLSKDGKYICYDSDREGYALDPYYQLDYMGNNQNGYSYYGYTYWGMAHYYFSTDYSFLNVIDEVGYTYVFHRTNGTQPSSTYYSMTESCYSNNETKKTEIISSNSESQGNSFPGRNTKRTKRVKCTFCKGTGISWSEKKYSPNYTGSDERQWCSRCNAWGIPHKHIDHRCEVCKNGYIEKVY